MTLDFARTFFEAGLESGCRYSRRDVQQDDDKNLVCEPRLADIRRPQVNQLDDIWGQLKGFWVHQLSVLKRVRPATGAVVANPIALCLSALRNLAARSPANARSSVK